VKSIGLDLHDKTSTGGARIDFPQLRVVWACNLGINSQNTKNDPTIYNTALTERLKAYPAVALVGPRQSGKTTLARSSAGNISTLNKNPNVFDLDLMWDRFVTGNKLIILDEAQSWPELFKRLRGTIDGDRKRFGRFLLLGSVSPSLMVHVSESLAGRLSLLELTPLLWTELPADVRSAPLALRVDIPMGAFLNRKRFPQWQKGLSLRCLSPSATCLSGVFPRGPQVIDRFLRMLAATARPELECVHAWKKHGAGSQTVNKLSRSSGWGLSCEEGSNRIRATSASGWSRAQRSTGGIPASFICAAQHP